MAKAASVLERLKELDIEREKLMSEAKNEALAAATAAVEELNALGFTYRLVEGGRANSTAPSSRTGTRTVKDEACPICNFKTSPPHDRRSHRTQEPKQPFTDAELKAKRLTKV